MDQFRLEQVQVGKFLLIQSVFGKVSNLISGSDVDVVRLIQRVLAITEMLVACLDRECLLLVKYSSITDLVD